MKEFCIVGAGGFGREFLFQTMNDTSFVSEYSFSGFVDDDNSILNVVSEEGILGNITNLCHMEREMACFLCIGNPHVRRKLYEKISKNRNIYFPSYINEKTIISKTTKVGQGSILCYGTIPTVNITVGNFVIINLSCTVGHDVIIEDFSTLYPSVNVSGNVRIGGLTEIGTGTQIIQGKNVGTNSIVGAGSVIVKDIDDNVVAVGAPARVIKKRD